MEEDSLFYGSNAAMPARHFPAFAACGRTGGGFRLEGHHSNAAYNRHITNLKPRPHSCASCSIISKQPRSLSPEQINTTAYDSLEHAAALSDSISMATGVWSHVLSSSTLCTANTAEASDAGTMPCGPAAIVATPTAACSVQHLVFEGPTAAAAAAGVCPCSCNNCEDAGCSMPTTFCSSECLQHSLWLHDGTDFTMGHMEQVLPRRPASAGAHCISSEHFESTSTNKHLSGSSSSGGGGGSSSSSSSIRRPHSTSPGPHSNRLMQHPRQQWEENHYRSLNGETSEEIAALVSRTTPNADRSSWFSHTPVQVLKIEREKQQAAEEAWLTQFHPTEGAKYPNRSAALHSCCYDEHQQQQHQQHVMGGDVRATRFDVGGCVLHNEDLCDMAAPVERQQQQGVAQALGLQWVHTTATKTAEREQQQQQHQQKQEEDSGCTVHSLVPGTDEELHPTVSELDIRATVVNSAAECAAARAAAAGAAAERDKPKPAWWEADAKLAQRVHMLLQPDNAAVTAVGKIGRGEYSATLALYDSMLAGNAAKAVQLQTEVRFDDSTVLQQLQTPEQMHAAWVGELSSRPVAARQRQVLVEAAVAALNASTLTR